MQVKDVLLAKSRSLHTIRPDHSVADAIARLAQHNIGSLPVVDLEGRLAGIFTERDVLLGIHEHGSEFAVMKIEHVMTRHAVTCDLFDDVRCAMMKMSDHQVGQLPVLDDEHKLAGVVSVGDLIKLLNERVEAENQHLLNYLYGPG